MKIWGQFPEDENNWLSSVFMNEGHRKLSIAIYPLSQSHVVCFGERKCSEDYFLVRRSVSPGDQLQTKHSAHSAAPLHPADKRRMLDKRSQQKTSLFPPIIESNACGGGGKTS